MMTGDTALRRVRISDGQSLSKKMMTSDDIVTSGSDRKPEQTPWIFFYWWLRRTFFAAYCIEYKGEMIGFIGLYNLVPWESAEISLVLFTTAFRRKGHGTLAVQMLSENPALMELAKTLIARVRKDNTHARLFWAKLGFEEVRMDEDVMVMVKNSIGRGEGRPASHTAEQLAGLQTSKLTSRNALAQIQASKLIRRIADHL